MFGWVKKLLTKWLASDLPVDRRLLFVTSSPKGPVVRTLLVRAAIGRGLTGVVLDSDPPETRLVVEEQAADPAQFASLLAALSPRRFRFEDDPR